MPAGSDGDMQQVFESVLQCVGWKRAATIKRGVGCKSRGIVFLSSPHVCTARAAMHGRLTWNARRMHTTLGGDA